MTISEELFPGAGSDRTEDINAAEKKAEFLADLLHWQADAAKQGRSTKPLAHWNDKPPFLNSRGFDGPMRGNALQRKAHKQLVAPAGACDSVYEIPFLRDCLYCTVPHYENPQGVRSYSAVGRLHDALAAFVSGRLPAMLGELVEIKVDADLIHPNLLTLDGRPTMEDVQALFTRINADIVEERRRQEAEIENGRLIASKTADDEGSSDAISAVLRDEIGRFEALHVDEQLLQVPSSPLIVTVSSPSPPHPTLTVSSHKPRIILTCFSSRRPAPTTRFMSRTTTGKSRSSTQRKSLLPPRLKPMPPPQPIPLRPLRLLRVVRLSRQGVGRH